MPRMSKRNPKVGFISLGCPKALVDSERILTQLRVEGYEIVPSYDKADLVVVNTCGFIDSAVEESLDAIGEAMARGPEYRCNRHGKSQALAVASAKQENSHAEEGNKGEHIVHIPSPARRII